MGVHDWVKPFCTKVRGDDGILDGFDPEFYIRFDCAVDTDNPDNNNTCDILIVPTGNLPKDGAIRVIANAIKSHIIVFLLALGYCRLPERIQDVLKNIGLENDEERERLRKSITKMNREFHDDLKHRETGL
jgi:hypothetical protein